MKRILFFALLVLTQTLCAQTIEPNLKWGKPTDRELQMTEYPDDKDADAAVLFSKLDVYYGFVEGDFKIYYAYKTRLKVLKPEGKRVADKSIVYQDNASNNTRRDERPPCCGGICPSPLPPSAVDSARTNTRNSLSSVYHKYR